MVKFVYQGNAVVAPVIDRGPYVKGRAWDLTAAASEALEFDGVGRLRYAVAVSYARAGARALAPPSSARPKRLSSRSEG